MSDLIGWGTPEHAADITEGRHPGTRDALQWLTTSHLPPTLRTFSAPFFEAAVSLIKAVTTDSPELSRSLAALIHAKDEAVRAGIRHQTGRAGSTPRPQLVVDPPNLAEELDRPLNGCSYCAVGLLLQCPHHGPNKAEALHHDEETLFKVQRAIARALSENTDIISEIQNEGILFRERVPE